MFAGEAEPVQGGVLDLVRLRNYFLTLDQALKAYLVEKKQSSVSVTDKKVLLNWHLKPLVWSFFVCSFESVLDELVFIPDKYFQARLIFVRKAEMYLSVSLRSLLSNIGLGGTNSLAYFFRAAMAKEENVIKRLLQLENATE